MSGKIIGKNLFLVGFSRAVSIISNIAIGLLLPKIFTVSDYGYFKVFTLYAVYTTLFHFGFVDGILLKLSGKNYLELNKCSLRGYTSFFVAFEAIIAALMISISAILADGEYLFIFVMLSFNMLFVNITTYYQFISQATQRFQEYSAKSIIVSIVKLSVVILFFISNYYSLFDVSYRIYLIILNGLDFLVLIWYISIYRDITFGEKQPFDCLKKDIIEFFKDGIILTVAYQVSHLVLVLDRQFVNILFSTEEFAIYSFAYNIVSMVSTMISSLSVVMLPMLKNVGENHIANHYKNGLIGISIVTGGSLLGYFPLVSFIEWFLPNYIHSLKYIAVVLPSVLFTACITVIMFTIDKVINRNLDFFKISCVILGLGFVSNVTVYLCFKTPQAISYASLVVMAIWFLVEGRHLEKYTKNKTHKEFCYIAILIISFLIIRKVVNLESIGFITYLALFVFVTFVFYFNFLKDNLSDLISKKLKKEK